MGTLVGVFHYEVGNGSQGPVSSESLIRMLQAGEISRTTLVWQEGERDRRPVGEVPGLVPPASLTSQTAPRGLAAQVSPRQQGSIKKYLLPTGRSVFAIAAGYFGLVGLFVPGLAWIGLIFGFLGLREIRRSQADATPLMGKGRAWFGIMVGTMWTVLFVAVLIVGW